MPTKPQHPGENAIIEVLTRLAIGSISAEDAASQVGMSLDELLDYVDTHPEAKAEADRLATERKSDPSTIARASLEGLAHVANELAQRAKNHGGTLSVSELTGLGGLLDKIAAVSATSAQKVKQDDAPERRTAKATMYIDKRPHPDGSHGFRFLHIPANHPSLFDTREFSPAETEEQRRAYFVEWANRWFPLTFQGRTTDIGEMLMALGPGGKLVDTSTGKVYVADGGAPE